jgi:transcription termination/antitermination protein NusG
MKWYVIKVVTGKEKKMKQMIETELKLNNSQHVVSQLLIPSQKSIQIRNGKKVNVDKNFFPGYILVECESINDVESNLKHVTGVSSILKQPLSQSEIDRILGRENKKEANSFYVGQKVKITDGPFSSFIGDIQELDLDKQKVKLSVLIFGREVLLDLTFLQIEKE